MRYEVAFSDAYDLLESHQKHINTMTDKWDRSNVPTVLVQERNRGQNIDHGWNHPFLPWDLTFPFILAVCSRRNYNAAILILLLPCHAKYSIHGGETYNLFG